MCREVPVYTLQSDRLVLTVRVAHTSIYYRPPVATVPAFELEVTGNVWPEGTTNFVRSLDSLVASHKLDRSTCDVTPKADAVCAGIPNISLWLTKPKKPRTYGGITLRFHGEAEPPAFFKNELDRVSSILPLLAGIQLSERSHCCVHLPALLPSASFVKHLLTR
jgi:hypothetical protein